MNYLLFNDRPVTYEDFLPFESILYAEEKKELDEDCFPTIHKARFFGEYDLARKKDE